MSKPKVNVFSLLMDSDLRHNASDAVVKGATDDKAVKAQTATVTATLREALKGAETPEEFAAVVTSYRETFGSHSNVARDAVVARAALKVASAATRTIIVEAFKRNLIGTGRLYPTQAALAAAVGVTPAYVTQNKPTPKAPANKGAGRPKATPEDTTPDAPEDTTPEPSDGTVALAQAVTRVESATRSIVATPENAAEVERLTNALEAQVRHLRSVVKGLKVA